MSSWNLWWWVILPYTALATFVIGHVWRWRYDQFGWTSRSTQLQESRMLKWGGPLFHYGTFGAIAGHALGILVPESFTRWLGIPEEAYRWFSSVAGAIAALGVLIGVAVLALRRTAVPRVRATTSAVDWLALVLLAVVIVLGVIPTVGINLFGAGYDYRSSVALWFRGLFAGSPDVTAIDHAPLIYQIHATAAWAILAVWPFSRLVHAWSFPLWYLWRPFIVYRSRVPAPPTEPGTSDRRWRSIGVRY
ncbi:respiratory nitrate reductase subunit gamma [Streptomyces odontomachi]|uniref:respiratory nitrate reductase subunit gamma n=1 Tax=Streptomyces odontomachi TaxID=2944940 RepID=UPI00210DB639|nr:respiratory nitrate reductase subunit gamma [Streptomyces sp. ODS25]